MHKYITLHKIPHNVPVFWSKFQSFAAPMAPCAWDRSIIQHPTGMPGMSQLVQRQRWWMWSWWFVFLKYLLTPRENKARTNCRVVWDKQESGDCMNTNHDLYMVDFPLPCLVTSKSWRSCQLPRVHQLWQVLGSFQPQGEAMVMAENGWCQGREAWRIMEDLVIFGLFQWSMTFLQDWHRLAKFDLNMLNLPCRILLPYGSNRGATKGLLRTICLRALYIDYHRLAVFWKPKRGDDRWKQIKMDKTRMSKWPFIKEPKGWTFIAAFHFPECHRILTWCKVNSSSTVTQVLWLEGNYHILWFSDDYNSYTWENHH